MNGKGGAGAGAEQTEQAVTKVNAICDLMQAAFKAEASTARWRACMVLTFVRRYPPRVEDALKHLQAGEDAEVTEGLEVALLCSSLILLVFLCQHSFGFRGSGFRTSGCLSASSEQYLLVKCQELYKHGFLHKHCLLFAVMTMLRRCWAVGLGNFKNFRFVRPSPARLGPSSCRPCRPGG